MTKKKKHKECLGCGDHFSTFKNYDYCVDCAVNGNRYLTKSPCSECDGSGMIKFRGQKPRSCKLCYLTKNTMSKNNQKPTAEEPEEKFWEEVDQLAQQKIYHLLTRNIPFQNIKLITEPWKFEDRQQKLSGLFLDRDVDFRTAESDISSQYDEEGLPSSDYLGQEISYWYLISVIKGLISSLSAYDCYDPSHFENLTP